MACERRWWDIEHIINVYSRIMVRGRGIGMTMVLFCANGRSLKIGLEEFTSNVYCK